MNEKPGGGHVNERGEFVRGKDAPPGAGGGRPRQATDWSPEDKDKFDGLRGKYYPALMRQKAPGLYEKLTGIQLGQVPVLTPEEKEFFIELIMGNERGISNVISEITYKIWGAWSVEWTEDGKRRRENKMAALWWHFNSSNARERAEKLINFYLGTTKEQAEAEIATWKQWEGRAPIKLI